MGAKKKAEEEAARKKAAEEAAAKKKAEEEADRKKAEEEANNKFEKEAQMFFTPAPKPTPEAEEKPLRKIEFAVIGKDDSKEGFVNAEWKYVLNKKALKAGNDRSGSIGSSDINSEALLALDGYDWNTIRIQNGSIDGSGFEIRWRMSDHRDVKYKLVMKLAKAETKKPTVFIKPPKVQITGKTSKSDEDTSSEDTSSEDEEEDPKTALDNVVNGIPDQLMDFKTKIKDFLRYILTEAKKDYSKCFTDIAYWAQVVIDAIRNDQGVQDFVKDISVPFWKCNGKLASGNNRRLQAPAPKDTFDSLINEWIDFIEDQMRKHQQCSANWMDYGNNVADLWEDGWNDNTGLYTLLTSQNKMANEAWRSCL